MPVVVELLDAQEHRVVLPDPSGGYFDAAGDFDRLIGHAPEALTTWALLQEYERVLLAPEQMPSLLADLDELLRVAKLGPEERGLRRLVAMAEACRDSAALSLRCTGD